jgi:CheY-like chemotaxis protein
MLQEIFGAFYVAGESNQNQFPSAPREIDSPDSEVRKPKVLVVDDEKRIADTMCEILNSAGFEAVAAYEGWSALNSAACFHPDYLLSDVLMPHMNGVELAIAIRQSCPSTKILLFSGQAGILEILQKAQELGFTFDLVAKPIHPARLIERLKEL